MSLCIYILKTSIRIRSPHDTSNMNPTQRLEFYVNKNTLTGRRFVRKQLDIMPTYHYVQNQGNVLMQSRENGQKPQFGQFLDRYLRNLTK